MNDDTATRLISSIYADRLVVLCGAGLSMASPSYVPSAAKLASECYDRYVAAIGPIDVALREDLEALTSFFLARTELDSIYVDRLVQWAPFNGDVNDGHLALADFLGCKALQATVSTNIDVLIEQASRDLGDGSFTPCTDAQDANRVRDHNPLLKLHGCFQRSRYSLLWCHDQLSGPHSNAGLATRIQDGANWLRAILPNRDLVLLGFWSDWKYLNDILIDALALGQNRLVVLVNPASPDELEAKAPGLWKWANDPGNIFRHEPQSGDAFLKELRNRFSERFLSQTFNNALSEYRVRTGSDFRDPVDLSGLNTNDYYALRRDVTGASPTEVVRLKSPEVHMEAAGAVHLQLRAKGATLQGSSYVLTDGRRVRVVNGLSRSLSRVKAKMSLGAPPDSADDLVICCASLEDGGAPASIIRSTTAPTMVRPASAATWLTEAQASTAGII